MRDVRCDLGFGERSEAIARNDSLAQLSQLGALQHRGQFGLADQDDLQQFALVRLQIGEQAHLFQNIGGQILRLVNDQHRMPAAGVCFEQIGVDAVNVPS